RTGAHLEDRHRRDLAILFVDLRHADFPTEQSQRHCAALSLRLNSPTGECGPVGKSVGYAVPAKTSRGRASSPLCRLFRSVPLLVVAVLFHVEETLAILPPRGTITLSLSIRSYSPW